MDDSRSQIYQNMHKSKSSKVLKTFRKFICHELGDRDLSRFGYASH